MDRTALFLAVIGAFLGAFGLLLSIVFAIYFYRRGLKGTVRLLLPAGMIGFFVLVRSVSFLAAYWPR